jgi:hypothetical protein
MVLLLIRALVLSSSLHGIVSMASTSSTGRSPFNTVFTNSVLLGGNDGVIDASDQKNIGMFFNESIVLVGGDSQREVHHRSFIRKNYQTFRGAHVFGRSFGWAVWEVGHRVVASMVVVLKSAHAWIDCWGVTDIEKLKIKGSPFVSLYILKAGWDLVVVPFDRPDPRSHGRDFRFGTFPGCVGGISRCPRRGGLLDNRIVHGGDLLMSETGINRGGQEGKSSKDGSPSRPKDLLLPIRLLFGAMLIGVGGPTCFRAFDVAGTGSFLHANLILFAGWILLDGGALLVFVTLGVW